MPTRRPIKDPDYLVTGNEEMTEVQEAYLHTLPDAAHESVAADVTKADASREIDRLQQKTGRKKKTRIQVELEHASARFLMRAHAQCCGSR